MKLGITPKLFLAILVANLVVVVAFAVAVQVSVNSGFRAYVVEREERRLEFLARRAGETFAAQGTFDTLRDPAAWQAMAAGEFGLPRRATPSIAGGTRPDAPPADGGRSARGTPLADRKSVV